MSTQPEPDMCQDGGRGAHDEQRRVTHADDLFEERKDEEEERAAGGETQPNVDAEGRLWPVERAVA